MRTYIITLTLAVVVTVATFGIDIVTDWVVGDVKRDQAQAADRVEQEREYRWTVRTIGGID